MRFVFLMVALGAFSLVVETGCASNGGTRPGTPSDGGDAGDGSTGDAGAGCTTAADCVDDGIFCNGTLDCLEGRCVAAPAPDCGDGVGCTQDECLAATDMCQNTPIDSECPMGTVCVAGQGCRVPAACEFDADCGGDGVFCNGDEVCIDSLCVSPDMRDCADTNNCTVDECVEASMMCMSTPADYLTDPLHCGPTGANDCVVCPDPPAEALNVTAACEAGACTTACAMGFADADRDGGNGCECEIGVGTDDPDGAFLDENCDGIDGDLARGILVSRSLGADSATCGLDFATPCQTIGHALTRAIGEARRDLFVMAGSYDEVVDLRDGIRIFGGYDTSWVRDARADAAHQTTITGGADSTDGQYMAVKAHDLIVAPTLENLVLVGPDAPSGMAGAGRSSYVVHAANVTGMELIRVTLRAGNAGNGLAGTAGGSASSSAAARGSNGGAADQFATACNDSSRGAGGGRGTNSCSGGSSPNAGTGGRGGTMDSDCGVFSLNLNARGGSAGASASTFATGSYGYRGAGSSTCAVPGNGQNGRITNGGAGVGGTDVRGRLMGRYWAGTAGGPGDTGLHGTGGGGGGGSGGCDDGTDSHGAGGGGGGAGGCAAPGGGTGGGSGGGSFGLFTVGATLNVSFCDIQRGNGGNGGTGGGGGRGQSGGPRGSGGGGAGGSQPGGTGGNGGHGGHGGGGGGGPGGPSFGIFSEGSTIVNDCGITGGSAGTGGGGGPSAPSAPAAERDGNVGTVGAAGILGATGNCTAAGGC